MFKIENSLFFILAFSMAFVVAISNYLVQFPIKYFNLQDLLTYGAFTYPIAFLITDLSNRRYGKRFAKKIVYLGFSLGVFLTLYFSTNFSDLISIRIAIGSGVAFLTAQLIDVTIFDKLRKKNGLLPHLFHQLLDQLLIHFYFFQFLFMEQKLIG